MRKSFLVFGPGATIMLLVLGSCNSGGGGAPSPSATPHSSSSAVSEPDIDLALAARLYAEGDVEQATAVYNQAIRGNDQRLRQEALWSLARLQYQEGHHSTAEDTVESFLDEDIAPEDKRLALLLKGVLDFAQGDNSQAEEVLASYLESNPPAAPYARLRLADLAARRGDLARAIAITSEALVDQLPPAVTTEARFNLARYQQDSGDIASALATYEQLGTDGETRSDRGQAFWLAAVLAHDSGDANRAAASVQTLVAAYPFHERSLEALDDPRFAPSIPLGSRALALFSQRVNGDADAAYREIVAVGDPTVAADAHYHLGILAERFENYDEALAQYDAAIAAASASQQIPQLGQALWDKGLALELIGRIDEAVQTYTTIADVAPSSEHTGEALFRAGILRFKRGLFADAAAIWGRQSGLSADGESQARAYFWAAAAARANDDEAAAQSDLELAAAVPGFDYYTLRARAELASESDLPAPADLPEGGPDWARVEVWLATVYGPEDPAAVLETFAGPSYQRAVELFDAGLVSAGQIELEQLVADATGNPWLLYRLARAALDRGLYSIAARAAGGFIGDRPDTPPAALTLIYPAVYPQLVNAEASRNSLAPHLLLALVRQESLYDPKAVSPAQAIGLTQVIPTTAEDIARDLEVDDFRSSDLMRPNVSLRFGAYYLAAQIEFLEGDIPAALSAYNGGAGNATRWQEANPTSDPDLFLESIDFAETRHYVELVLENYAMYLYAYGLTDQPYLPLN